MFGEEWERHHNRVVDSARASAKGLPREQLVPGAIVTLSPCRCTGDRSYSHELYEILAANPGHVVIKQVNPREHDTFGKRAHTVSIHEHEFYGAEHLLEVMKQNEAAETVDHLDRRTSTEEQRGSVGCE